MLTDPYEEIKRRKNNENIIEERKIENWLFTRSRILFLISVFAVFSLPLIYRYFSIYLK